MMIHFLPSILLFLVLVLVLVLGRDPFHPHAGEKLANLEMEKNSREEKKSSTIHFSEKRKPNRKRKKNTANLHVLNDGAQSHLFWKKIKTLACNEKQIGQ